MHVDVGVHVCYHVRMLKERIPLELEAEDARVLKLLADEAKLSRSAYLRELIRKAGINRYHYRGATAQAETVTTTGGIPDARVGMIATAATVLRRVADDHSVTDLVASNDESIATAREQCKAKPFQSYPKPGSKKK